MPSPYQSGGTRRQYDSEVMRLVDEKDASTLRALVRGIHRVDVARDYVKAELALADDEGREPRRDLIGFINSRIAELEDDEGDGAT